MIHARQLPLKPDMTYFRGDRTRPVEIVKIDVERNGEKNKDDSQSLQEAKVVSVTNIWTEDATLLDSGSGMDTADVYAHGPGRLETRPDRDQPVERIAIWQDTLIVKNVLGPDNEILHKVIDLTGNRPCFIDNLQKTSLDSASWIQVWLKPKVAPANALDQAPKSLAQRRDHDQNSTGSTALAGVDRATFSAMASQPTAENDKEQEKPMGGGNLQIEQLHALFDVHLLAPSKTMTARDRFDAEFVEAKVPRGPSAVSSRTSSGSPGEAPLVTGTSGPTDEQGQQQVGSDDQTEKAADDPPMTGSCNRLWARIELKPESQENQPSRKRTPKTPTVTAESRNGETNAEIRKVWMFGNVALHQDPKKEDVKDSSTIAPTNGGTDASGEALYLDNRGPNLAITYIYQRDPTETTYLPGPLPPACVDSKDKDPKRITAAGSIKLNQQSDQAWVIGPGTITQLTARAFFSDKTPGTNERATDNAREQVADIERPTGQGESQVKIRSTSIVRDDAPDRLETAREEASDTKPKTRAGVPLSQKVPMTIGFSEKMEFTGRSVDPEHARQLALTFTELSPPKWKMQSSIVR